MAYALPDGEPFPDRRRPRRGHVRRDRPPARGAATSRISRASSAGSRGVLRSTTHPLTTAGLEHDGDRRQRRPARALGLRRARRGRLRPAARQRQLPARAGALGPAARAPAAASGVVNVPFTWPAPEVDGFALAGFDAAAREDGMTLPARAVAELRRQFGALGARPPLPDRRHGARRPRPRAPRRRAEGRGRALARATASSPSCSVRRLHGRRPHPPPLLAGVGRARPREPRGRGLPHPRRGRPARSSRSPAART